tara:strand:+ start:4518 stop:5153 length:636 start_codon:yes stop_codon:yes gene_type:complete
MKKDIYFFVAHIDDFEISCLGYLAKHGKKYNKINVFIATDWEKKRKIWSDNLKLIQHNLGLEISYHNFGYEQRTLMTKLDSLKDDFYKKLDFDTRFDIVSHDENDCHTDHIACNLIALGMFKYTSKFVTIYSPSSRSFKSNYWISLFERTYQLKKECIDKYNIKNEQSYSKTGYYMQSESHYNIGKAYYLENFTYQDYHYYETYRVLKEVV